MSRLLINVFDIILLKYLSRIDIHWSFEASSLKSMLFYLNLKFLFSLKLHFFGLITCHNIIVVVHAWLEKQFFVHTRNTNRRINRSSHQRCSIKKGVLKNFAAFTGTPVPLLFFNKVAGLTATGRTASTLFKKRLWHRCFLANFAKFVRTPFLQNTYGRLFLYKLNVEFQS